MSAEQERIAVLEKALSTIAKGCANGAVRFREVHGDRRHLTWLAVNVLQDHLEASKCVAEWALEGRS